MERKGTAEENNPPHEFLSSALNLLITLVRNCFQYMIVR